MPLPDWAPAATDLDQPSAARIYDYLLGGSHHFAVDRDTAQQLVALLPELPLQAQANRAFLRRSVRFLVDAGIRQFLDLGSGIPTVGNVHEIAQQAAPEARVVYVDVDPVAVAHSRELLAGNDRTTVVQDDLRAPDRIVAHPAVRGLLDLDRPVAVLIVAVLHFLPDADEPFGAVAAIRDALAPGSYLALTHADTSGVPPAQRAAGEQLYARSGTFVSRSLPEVARFFTGFSLVEPGLVEVSRWRPDSENLGGDPQQSVMVGGVGRRDG